MTTPTLHLGKVKSKPDDRDCKFGDYLPGLKKAGLLPKLPEKFGHGNDLLEDKWLMLGNGPKSSTEPEIPSEYTAAQNGAGDCFFAGEAHRIMAANYNAGNPVPIFNATCVLKQYAAYSKEAFGKAYDLKTGENDEGSEPRSGFKFIQQHGFYDASGKVHHIGTYLACTPKDMTQLYYLLYLLEGAGIGIECPASAQTQFGEKKLWKPVPGSEILGGHWIYGVGSPAPGYWAAITWAERVVANVAFYSEYNDETWGVVMPESFKKTTGKDWEGYDPAHVEEYLTLTARQKAAA